MYLDYYVYSYIRTNGTPYYIGKGRKNRAYIPHRKYGKGVYTPKDKRRIVFLEKNLTNIGALAIERRMIEWYGRRDLGEGILHNRTDGGDGSERGKWKLSEETKLKMSIAAKGKPKSAEHIINNSKAQLGKKLSVETRKKMSKSHTGRPSGMLGKTLSAATREKMSFARKGKTQKVVVCPHCGKSGGNKTMPRWHLDNCKHKEK